MHRKESRHTGRIVQWAEIVGSGRAGPSESCTLVEYRTNDMVVTAVASVRIT